MIPDVPTGDFALFLDVDGTLIDIAPHPDLVVVPRSLVRDLRSADRLLGGALALISGRTIANLDTLFQPLRLRASGVHGAEFRFDTLHDHVTADAAALPENVWSDVSRVVDAFPGTMVENKAFSFAVHYRSAPDARLAVLAALEEVGAMHADLHLKIMPGHFVYELKRADFNKGVAIDRFMQTPEFRGRRPIFVGDDVTDWPGFTAAIEQDGLAYSVGAPAPNVMGTFQDPKAVRRWLRQIIPFATVSA